MINLCELFGVEEKEEFKIIHRDYKHFVYTISNNILWYKDKHAETFTRSSLYINNLNEFIEIIKLPKKKQFTSDELCILRNIDSEYNWVARSSCENTLLIFAKKPVKNDLKSWSTVGKNTLFNAYNHLFQNIQWEDEEPVFIDDYVERGTE